MNLYENETPDHTEIAGGGRQPKAIEDSNSLAQGIERQRPGANIAQKGKEGT